jgi:hypothetical protein
MQKLNGTRSLQVVLAGAKTSLDCPVTVSYEDTITGNAAGGDTQATTTNGVAAVTVCTAPSGFPGSIRTVKSMTLPNIDTGPITLTVQMVDTVGPTTTKIFSPVTLQIGDQLAYTESDGWRVLDTNGNTKSSVASGGRLLRAPQVITSGTTYTPPPGCNAIDVELIGAGGGGGGGSNTASNAAVGGGGAAGAYARKYFTNPGVAALTIAIGAGGTAGANTGGTGGTGGDTTFALGATTVTAKGGLGGVGSVFGTTALYVAGGAGVIATNGDVNAPGAPGEYGSRASGTIAVSGAGGSTSYGGGGVGKVAEGAGNTATGFGGGGGGALSLGGGAVAGGVGAPGLIIVREYT